MAGDTTSPVKGIDGERVSEWLEAHVDGVRPPLRFEMIVGGHSNLTYEVTDARGARYVLRRPPLGAILATAHDMAREHRIISALGATDVPVPPALGLCEDEAVNGAPFYVMGFVDGVVLVDADTVRAHFGDGQRRRIGESLVGTLATLHRVDPDAVGLGKLGRKEAYLARQLERWRTQWESSKTRELEDMETVYRALRDRMPEQAGATIVHGDFRLGNCLTGADGRIAAVLDWELCTLGDPLADVGFLMNDWRQPGEGEAEGGPVPGPTASGGFPTREEMLAAYSEATGRDTSGIDYYRAFQYWRLAAIVEGVLARYLKGVMGGEVDTELYKWRVEELARGAVELMERL
jgi:aminoglycoside phosphotransferase (APT) family kinase protein